MVCHGPFFATLAFEELSLDNLSEDRVTTLRNGAVDASNVVFAASMSAPLTVACSGVRSGSVLVDLYAPENTSTAVLVEAAAVIQAAVRERKLVVVGLLPGRVEVSPEVAWAASATTAPARVTDADANANATAAVANTTAAPDGGSSPAAGADGWSARRIGYAAASAVLFVVLIVLTAILVRRCREQRPGSSQAQDDPWGSIVAWTSPGKQPGSRLVAHPRAGTGLNGSHEEDGSLVHEISHWSARGGLGGGGGAERRDADRRYLDPSPLAAALDGERALANQVRSWGGGAERKQWNLLPASAAPRDVVNDVGMDPVSPPPQQPQPQQEQQEQQQEQQKRRWGLLAARGRDKGLHTQLNALSAELGTRLGKRDAEPSVAPSSGSSEPYVPELRRSATRVSLSPGDRPGSRADEGYLDLHGLDPDDPNTADPAVLVMNSMKNWASEGTDTVSVRPPTHFYPGV